MKLQSLIRRTVLSLILVATAYTVHAQVGTGWSVATFSQRFEYESNDVLITISPPPSSFNNGYCAFTRSGGSDRFQLLSHHSNRAEVRPNDDYSSGSRQLQADVLFTYPSSDQCIFQTFNGPAGPWLLLRQETNFNGSLMAAGGGIANTTIATNLSGTWFRFNAINDMNNGQCYLYVNGKLVWQKANPGGTFYTKYGVYGSHDDAHPANIIYSNVVQFSGGNAVKQDFTLTATSSQTVLVGNTATYTATATFTNTVNNTVYFSVSGLPTGATASFSPSSVVGTGSSTLTVDTSSSTPPGTYTLTITGATSDSSDITHTVNVTLKVQDFSVSATPGSQTVASGGTATGTATVTAANGFGGTVTWTGSGLPSGATATFSPTTVSGAGSSSWSVALPNTTPAGTYTITITGTSGGVSHSANVTIIVSDFSISASPSSQTVTAGNGTTYTATLGSINGFNSAVTLSVSGLPSGATGTFSPTSVTPVGTSTLTVSTTTAVVPGTYTLTLSGGLGSLSHSTTVTLVVTAPITLPAPWTDADIGSVGVAGDASYTSPTFTLDGSGSDIWGTADSFHYAYQSTAGDLAIAAHVASEENTSGWAKAGVMVRESTAANAAYVGVYITPSNGVSMQVRTATGVSAIDLARQAGPVAPYWVKIVRSGSTFSGYSSTDGTTWTLVGSTNITMATSATAGLVDCSHNNTTLNTSTFDSVTVGTYAFFEAEALTVVTNTQTVTVLNDTNCSGGQFIQLNGTNVNDLIKFLVPGINAGTYDVRIGVKDNYNRATVQTYTGRVGGGFNAFGAVFDEYTATATYPEIDLGSWTVSTSDKYVGFNVTGHNASSSSYVIAIDYIELVPQ